ncbi:hypothetical protein DM01DRAFT_1371390 [Hesseltinella vesiculosa]|uniref:Uncharacterized protein n=1 Tax=Hesseltinella vesiculosa TaxID=101127 RepID=A0A1X2GQW1_9FUNG|nr:hypothetical protein DM01DRAFT_1371390 [Hesseltinella vesiculosa]
MLLLNLPTTDVPPPIVTTSELMVHPLYAVPANTALMVHPSFPLPVSVSNELTFVPRWCWFLLLLAIGSVIMARTFVTRHATTKAPAAPIDMVPPNSTSMAPAPSSVFHIYPARIPIWHQGIDIDLLAILAAYTHHLDKFWHIPCMYTHLAPRHRHRPFGNLGCLYPSSFGIYPACIPIWHQDIDIDLLAILAAYTHHLDKFWHIPSMYTHLASRHRHRPFGNLGCLYPSSRQVLAYTLHTSFGIYPACIPIWHQDIDIDLLAILAAYTHHLDKFWHIPSMYTHLASRHRHRPFGNLGCLYPSSRQVLSLDLDQDLEKPCI